MRPAVQRANVRESWERPNAGGVRHTPLIELFGGYGFARFDNGAGVAASNLNGIIGSFGWNIRPWLQIVADSSYDVVTISGTKNVLYGNHWGPRIFRRVRNRWGLTPFVEGLVGGSRADTTISGTGGYSTSQNCISYKVGGGLDIKPSRHFEIRLLDVDYYRTSFGTNLHQNNIWASAGIVIRLFGGSE
jgi:opacity protein-like surface antigen